MNQRDRLIELIEDYTENVTARELHSQHFDEKFADHLLANGVIVPPCKVGDKIWVIERKNGKPVDFYCIVFLSSSKGFVIGTPQIDHMGIDKMIDYHIRETANEYETNLVVYPEEDCFVTREEAEKALKEKSQ